jgi:hypothetical protein
MLKLRYDSHGMRLKEELVNRACIHCESPRILYHVHEQKKSLSSHNLPVCIACHITCYSFRGVISFRFNFSFVARTCVAILLFQIASAKMHAVEQQLVVHWKSSTSAESTELLKDRNGGKLQSGAGPNHDGDHVILGYFTEATSSGTDSDLFLGEWVPLTTGTKIGDSSSGYGYGDGMFSFTTVFTIGTNSVSVYPNEPAGYLVTAPAIINTTTPTPGSPIAIRFYDLDTVNGTVKYNTVSHVNWKWPAVSGAIPSNLYIKASSGTATASSKWIYGNTFEAPGSPFQTVLGATTTLSLSAGSGGSAIVVDSIATEFDYGEVLTVKASADATKEFLRWGDGNGGLAEVAEPTLDTTTVTMTKAITVKAIFQDVHHDVVLSTSGGGDLDGNGSFVHGSSPTITATPLTGYQFMKWDPATGLTDSNLATTTIQSLDQDRTYVADFDPIEYTSAQIEGQTTNGGNVELQAGPKLHFSDYSLRAIPWRGYSFENWTSGTNSLSALSSPLEENATLTVDGPATFTANFVEDQYSLAVSTPNHGWGSVTPSDAGPYLFSQSTPVSAAPQTGYKFSNWTGDVGALSDPLASSTDANMTILAKNVSLQAHFAPKTYILETNSTTGGSITVSPPETVQHKVTYPIKATPESGYTFTGWETNSSSQVIILDTAEETMVYISNTPGFSLEEGDKISITAKFSALPYTLSASASSGGKVKMTGMGVAATQGSGTFPADETPTIEAFPSTGYLFSHWGEDNATLGNATAPTTTVNMAMLNRNVSIEANFAKKTYGLTAQVSGSGMVDGVETLSNTYSHFDQASFLATPSAGWHFDHWSWDDATNFPGSVQPSTTFIVTGAVNLTAHFSRNLYQLSFVNVLNGSATGSGDYSFDSNATITATPHDGYVFSHWSGPTPLPLAATDASTTTVRMPVGDIALTPNFAPKGGIVAEVQSSGQGSVSGGGIFLFDSNVTITATPASPDGDSPQGYYFKQWTWTSTNATGSTDENPYSFTIDSNITLTAEFLPVPPDSYYLQLNKSTPAGGTTNGSGYVVEGALHTISATPAEGYTFLGWESEQAVTLQPNDGSASAGLTINQDTTLTAHFREIFRKLKISAGSGGTATGGRDAVAHGTQATIVAIPDANHTFDRWNIEKEISYKVTLGSKSIGTSNTLFSIEGENRPHLSLVRGFTYKFEVNTNGKHPFYLSENPEYSSTYDGEYLSGVTGSKVSDGNLTFTVPATGPNLLYYHSPNAGSMGSPITILNKSDSEILPGVSEFSNNISLIADYSLQATFAPKLYTLNVLAGEGGSLQGENPSGSYRHGDQVEISANEPDNEHYVFSGWTGNGITDSSNRSTTVLMTGDSFVTAQYSPKLYTINANSDPANLGVSYIDPDGQEKNSTYNSTVTLVATPNPGNTFTHWTGISVANPYSSRTTHTVTEAGSATAHFKAGEYRLNVSSYTTDPSGTILHQEGGTITAGSSYVYGSKANIRARPFSGFEFVEWNRNKTINYDISVSQTLTSDGFFVIKGQDRPSLVLLRGYTYNFNLDGSSTLGNKFYMSESPDSNTPYTAGITGSPADSGLISFVVSQSTPDKLHYGVLGRAGFGNEILILNDDAQNEAFNAKDATTSVSMLSDKSVTAVFRIESHSIAYDAIPSYGGTVSLTSGDNPAPHDSDVTLTASPAQGFKFESWSGDDLSTIEKNNPVLTLTLTSSKTVAARFVQIGEIELILSVSPPEGGSVSGAGRYSFNPTHPISATPKLGYKFVKWEGDGIADANRSYTKVDLTSDRSLTAVFEKISEQQFALNFSISPIEGGRTNGSGYFTANTSHPISAEPNSGYRFIGWQGEGIADNQVEQTTLSLTSDRTISVIFEKTAAKNTSGPDLLAEALSDFDPIVYLDRNADLKSTYKDNLAQAFNHFVNQGFAEGRPYKPDPSASQPATPPTTQPKTMEKALVVFDPVVYLSLNPDLASFYGTNLDKAKDHFVKYGFELGRAFVPATFSPSATPIPAHGFTSLDHALEAFEADEYLALNPMISSILGINNLTAAKSHFIQYGFKNGLGFSTTATSSNTATPDPTLPTLEQALADFDPLTYLNVNYAVHEAIGNDLDGATEHFIAHWEEHRETYKDTSESENLGGKLPEDMSLDQALQAFDPSNYLAANPDIASTLGNDLKTAEKHFINHGYEQGREFRSAEQNETTGTTPSTSTRTLSEALSNFDPSMYLALNPDLETTIGNNPDKLKEHFVTWGNNAGRPTQPEDLSTGFTNDGVGTGNQGLFTLRLTVFPYGSGSLDGGGEFPVNSFPSIVAEASSGYVFTEWQGDGITDSSSPSTTVSLTANREIFAVFRNVGTGEELPIARIPGSNYIGWDWWTTEWFGSYWHQTGTQWVYHESLGWIFLVPYSEDSVWMWVDYLGGWHWTAKDIYPFLHDNNTSTWLWFDTTKLGTNDTRMFFRYLSGQTTGNWESR